MTNHEAMRQFFSRVLASPFAPDKLLARQLRRPSGPLGRLFIASWLNQGNAPLVDATLRALELQESEHFLDVGFGGGYGLQRASKQTSGQLYGADFSSDMVVRASRTLGHLTQAGRLTLITADVADLPLRDHLVHAIATTNTIYFWPDLSMALNELRRVLVVGGRVAFGYTGREKMKRFEAVTQHGFRTFMPEDLETALGATGFQDTHTFALQTENLEGDFVTVAYKRA